ncbi:MAG: type II toxin-antitoxin system RelE/ParE family toxin [Cyanobacteria bacterium J06628_6]
MSDESSPVQVELSSSFQRQLRKLAKRYRSIRKDLDSVTQQLSAGNLLGVQVPGFEGSVYKVRVRNSDIQKGKSAGYRVIYYLKATDLIILLAIYSKSDLADMSVEEIRDILAEFTE